MFQYCLTMRLWESELFHEHWVIIQHLYRVSVVPGQAQVKFARREDVVELKHQELESFCPKVAQVIYRQFVQEILSLDWIEWCYLLGWLAQGRYGGLGWHGHDGRGDVAHSMSPGQMHCLLSYVAHWHQRFVARLRLLDQG